MSDKLKIGFAMCGSFCTFDRVIKQIEYLSEKYDIVPIMSETAYTTDTRFGKASDFISKIEAITGHNIIHLISQAEPIGPKKLLDALIIEPCTGNTLAKLALGIADTSVTLAAKAHLRNARPLIIAVSTNDALASNAKSIGMLLNQKNVYFVPFKQDDPTEKPASIVAVMEQTEKTLVEALGRSQIQPIISE